MSTATAADIDKENKREDTFLVYISLHLIL